MIPDSEAKFLVVDDEALARDRLRRLLRKHAPKCVVDAVRSGEEAVRAIVEYEPHAVFLDIQLGDLTGFDVIDAIGVHRMPPIVFVTAYDEYAIRAFDVHALDYLVKPYTEDRFVQALDRLRSRTAEEAVALQRVLETVNGRAADYVQRLLVRAAQEGVLLIKVPDIDYIEAANNYVKLHVGARTHLLREKLSALEQRLDPAQFARIHRSVIVNMDRIVSLRPSYSGDYIVRLESGTEVRLSRTYRDIVQKQLGGHVDLNYV
jgi:two-component system LytT family response regulator